jgi:uncharacterized protein YbjT (DUF2867 family)
MKYVITGGAGRISGPLTEKLLGTGHLVTVIGRDASKLGNLKEKGAVIAAGSVEDPSFLAFAFSGADAAYLMIPPNFQTDDFREYQHLVGQNYIAALKSSGIRKVVFLSSIGAHMGKGSGPVDGLSDFEQLITKELPGTDVVFLRPSYFYQNFYQQAGMIRGMNIMGGNFSFTDEKMVLTDPSDIAEAAFQLLNNPVFSGKTVQYIASDERTTEEISKALAAAAGKPGTPWIEFTDEQALAGMLQSGLPAGMAKDYVDMGIALREGKMQEDYWKNRPTPGKVKLEDFAKEFATVYANS